MKTLNALLLLGLVLMAMVPDETTVALQVSLSQTKQFLLCNL